jgi:CheY-like chemotaxis protein
MATIPLLRLLWVDDHIDALLPYVTRLRESGFDVFLASTVHEAETMLSERVFDLLILDWYLGDDLGTSLIDRMQEKFSGLPVVVLSSYLGNESVMGEFAKRDLDIHFVDKAALPQPSDDFDSSDFVTLLRDLASKRKRKRSRKGRVSASRLPFDLRLKILSEPGLELEAAFDSGLAVTFVSYEWLLMHNLMNPKSFTSIIEMRGRQYDVASGILHTTLDTEHGQIEAELLYFAVVNWRDSYFGENRPYAQAVIGRDFLERNNLSARFTDNRWNFSSQDPLTVRRRRHRRSRPAVAASLSANLSQITLSSNALLLLIDERLGALEEERPNSLEARGRRDEQIEDYRNLRGLVEEFTGSVVGFAKGALSERAAVKATMSFAEGIRSWWTKKNQVICQRAFDMTLFLSSVAICSMAGAGGAMAVAVSGALVGGKTVVEAIKTLGGGKLPHEPEH